MKLNVELLTTVGVLATGATLAIAGLTLVLAKIAKELEELNAHLREKRGSK